MKVSIRFTEEVQDITIRDRYNNDNVLKENFSSPAWEAIPLTVTGDGGSPQAGRLQITGSARARASDPWRPLDELLDVGRGLNDWPDGDVVSLVRKLVDGARPADDKSAN